MRDDLIPWNSLRAIGNSRAAKIAAVIPLIGYLIILNDRVLIEVARLSTHVATQECSTETAGCMLGVINELRMHFVYFGLFFVGLGSIAYSVFCNNLIKKYADAEDFITRAKRILTFEEIVAIYAEHSDRSLVSEHSERNKGMSMEFIYALLNTARPGPRYLTAVLYALGFTLLAIPSGLTFIQVVISAIQKL